MKKENKMEKSTLNTSESSKKYPAIKEENTVQDRAQNYQKNIEYYDVLPISLVAGQGYRIPGTKNSLAVGFDIETGGHVFQLHITNSSSMTESNFITGNKGSWGKGDILFGFNISRVFNVTKKHNKEW